MCSSVKAAELSPSVVQKSILKAMATGSYLKQCERPPEMSSSRSSKPTAGYQNWRHLVFLHWRIDPEVLQAQLPKELTVETFDGIAWLGLVPFAMEQVRSWWSPSVPGISWFLETNVRTYVRHQSGLSAVWFFSLDANSRLAVRIARTFWRLNYVDCRMTLSADEQDRSLHYTGRRIDTPEDEYDIHFQLPDKEPTPADEETLEHFLLERYSLLTQTPAGHFLTADVMHEPYRFIPVDSLQCRENYTSRLVGEDFGFPAHSVYSPGVDVRVSALERVG
jgi:uncharacterized protein YqjF (DUF2071 family)